MDDLEVAIGTGGLDAEKHDFCCLTLQATTKSHGTKQSQNVKLQNNFALHF
jgi:hypothetical protein